MLIRNRLQPLFRSVIIAILIAGILGWIKVSPAQESPPLLEITSPPDGTLVAPGETITVVATPAPGTNFAMVMLIGTGPIGFGEVKGGSPPYEFS